MRRPSMAVHGLVLLVLLCATEVASAQSISFIGPPTTLGSGLQSSSARARLSDSQHGGVFVTLTVVDSLLARVAPDGDTPGAPIIDVFLPNGSTDAFLVVQALEGATGPVQVEASAPGFTTASFVVDLVTPYYEISGLGTSTDVPDLDDVFEVRVGVAASASSNLSLQEARAGGPGFDVEVSVDDPVVAELVGEFNRGQLLDLFIAPGSFRTPTSVASGGVALDGLQAGTVEVTAQIDGLLAQDDAVRTVTVNPAAIGWVGLPAEVGSGLRRESLRARLNGPSHGGVTLEISSLDPSRLLLASADGDTGVVSFQAFVPDGSTDVIFGVDGLEGVTGVVGVEATAPGWVSAVEGVEVKAPYVALQGLSTSQDTLDPPDAFYARVGLSSTGTSITSLQTLRVGSPGVDLTFVVDDSTLAMLETNEARNDTITLSLPEGEFGTPTTFETGGVQLDGIGAGTATVGVSAPGFIPAATAQRTVTISQPSISFIGLPGKVAAGHVTGLMRARLGASQHGGTTVRIEVADPGLARVSVDPGVVGTDFVDVFVPDGSIDALFYSHGLEGVVDTVQVTATATQFLSVGADLEVVAPALQVAGLGATLDTADPVDEFYARTGYPISNGSSISLQALRPGSPGLDVEFTLSDSTVAQLVTSGSSAGSQEIPVTPGEFQTPTTLGAGGLALEGLVPGSVVVSARAPGYEVITASDRSVTIVQPTISWIGTGGEVGAGLQTGQQRARLSGGLHGGVTVRIESTDPSRLLVSADESTPGSTFVDVFVPDGSIDAFFYSQALEGVTGTVGISATAPGFANASTDMTVVEPALEISGLSSTLSVGALPDAFDVRSGLPNSNGTAVSGLQEPRAGGGGVEVTIESLTPAVAELVTLGGAGSVAVLSIPEGEFRTPNSIEAGGVGARGLSSGSSVIQVTAPGFTVVGTSQREVTVASNGIGLAGVPAFLGARLQTPVLVAQLDDPSHGGVTLSIASGDTNLVLVAPDPVTPGAASLDVFLPNGVGSAQYVLQGREGGTGNVTVSATAGGAAGSVVFEVVEPALQIVGLPDSLEIIDPDEAFAIQTGISSAGGDSLAQRQAVRTGAGPLAVSVVNALVDTGDLVTSALQADSLVVEVAEAAFQSPATVNGGGVAFDPRLPGTTTLTLLAPGFLTTVAGSLPLVVFGDPTSSPVLPRRLALEPNVPNPFNPSTRIRFALPEAGRVRLDVLDLRGRRVQSLVDGELEAGLHTLEWQGRDERGRSVASGVYFLRLDAAGHQKRQKMVLLK